MKFSFHLLTRSDFELMSRWLSQPHVEKWWEHEWTIDAIERDFGTGVDRIDPVEYFVVWLQDEAFENQPIGFIQRHIMRDNPDWHKALQVVDAPLDAIGIDYFIGELELTGKGIGTAMIGAFIADTRQRYPRSEMLVDIDPDNRASWRALEKNGFVHVWTGELDSPDLRDDGIIWLYRLE
jgi:aminoglycoside 6'-N-acetyltransferase